MRAVARVSVTNSVVHGEDPVRYISEPAFAAVHIDSRVPTLGRATVIMSTPFPGNCSSTEILCIPVHVWEVHKHDRD